MGYPAVPYRGLPGVLERTLVSEIRYGDWLELVIVERDIDIDLGGEGTVSGSIENFYPGTTVIFTATCSISAVAQDITGDTLTVFIKTNKGDDDDEALLQADADVTTQGASGIATFTLTPIGTAITPSTSGAYHLEIVWTTSAGAVYIPHQQSITVLERVSDVS